MRGFTQDDAHIFCTPEQLAHEVPGCVDLIALHLEHARPARLPRAARACATRPATSTSAATANWEQAEQACRRPRRAAASTCTGGAGEAAFYGPKIDFVVRDCIGREWQLGTVQVDYNLPERFELRLHRARTTAATAGHDPPGAAWQHGALRRRADRALRGAFPLWLAPVQVRVLPISEKTNDYAHAVHRALAAAGLRAKLDDSGDRIQAKIRHAAEMRIPYLAIVGPRDAQAGQVSVRARGIQKDLGSMPLDAFVQALAEERDTKGQRTVRDRFAEPAGV
ncbi:MAG: hypothetical protein KatS3mg103_1256 [Phycisphaerales bacterium]|nr:MAG: hypothetical protein KatS3mg103_1256 [Phycisphaerales bacterium]